MRIEIRNDAASEAQHLRSKPAKDFPPGLRSFGLLLKRVLGGVAIAAFTLIVPVLAANSPPAMIVPGQFNVSATGAFTYTIPIAVPPGTAGMVPALSLDYSSQSGDGLEGLGWTLSGLPSIGRCPKTLAQDGVHGSVNYNQNSSTNDRFCLEGQRLVAISGSYGADGTVYRTEIEGFSKIISHGSSGLGPAYFEVHTKAGQIMYFGWDEDSDNSSNNSRLTLSTTNLTARAWAVEKIKDTKGNFLIVKYTNDMTNGQAYPNEIDYTGNDNASLTPYASVKFVYEARAVSVPTYQAGYLQQNTQLLENIETFYGTAMVTNYKLAYTAGSGATHDKLTSVTQCDGGSNCLKPTTFGWQGTGATVSFGTPSSTSLSLGSDLNSVVLAADFNGDGLNDALPHIQGTSCTIWFGSTTGTFSASSFTTSFSWVYDDPDGPPVNKNGNLCFEDVAASSLLTLDYDGDGLADIAVSMTNMVTPKQYVLHNTGSALNDVGTYPPIYVSGMLGDYNGDGRTDYLNFGNGGSPYIYTSNGNGTFTQSAALTDIGTYSATQLPTDFDGDGCADILTQGSVSSPRIVYSCTPAVSTLSVSNWVSSGYAITLGDFNGDGKTDILRTGNGDPPILYLSSGTTLVPYTLSFSDWGKYTIVAGDFNGDGKTDLMLVADGVGTHYGVTTPHQIWLSTGSSFVEATTIANSGNSADNPVSGTPAIRAEVADWNSDGAADIWLLKPSGDLTYINNSFTPELMNSVTNGIGVTTTVYYDRINKNGSFYAKCSNGTYVCGDAYPTQDVDGPLYAVSDIDSSNGIGGTYSSMYSYGGAQTDLKGRGFLGFGSVTIKDLQTGIVQTTTYATQFPETGLIASQTKICPAPTCTTAVTLNSTTNTFETISLGTGTDGVARTFVGLHQTVVASKDLNGATFPTTTTTYTYDCDSGGACGGTSPTGFGNATKVAVSVSDGSSKTTTNTYTNDTTNWYLGRLTAANVESVVGSSDLTRQTSYGYISSSGLLSSELVEPETSSDPTLKLETDYGYDTFGNKTSATTKGCVWVSSTSCSTTTGSASRATTTAYDTTTYHGQFATKITNALSQSETWAYSATNNLAFGLPSGHTGPNGLTTSWTYDTFGRKTLETRPDGNQTAVAYTYCAGLPTGESCPTNAQFDTIATPENSSSTQNGPITVTYYDGLSRPIAVDSEGFDATGTGCTTSAPCWIRVATQYDANGRVAQTSRPYFISGGTAQWTVYTYDTLGRVTKATYPDASKTQYGFNGLTTTVTNDKSQVTTTVKNAQGLNASVEDANSKTTSYVYDAFGDLLTVTDPTSNVTTNTYDIRGRKLTAADPDMGTWHYVYDGYGELYSQTDAKSQVTTIGYDSLGRVLRRNEPDLVSTWTYDTATYGIGQLASATTNAGYSRVYTYDSLGRPSTDTIAMDHAIYNYATHYNTDGRIATQDYPSGFSASFVYTTLGYLYQVKDYNLGTVFWTAKTRDAELHLLTTTAGNGITTTNGFNPETGLITSIQAGTGNTVANQSYSYDTLGDLTTRTWLNNAGASTKENACYDVLNRLTNTLVTSGTACTGTGSVTIAFDALGNITSKSDVCSAANCFGYGAGAAGPHAITAITGTYMGLTNPVIGYDANGNMTCVSTASGCTGTVARTASWTSFNMAATITEGSNSATLTYDSEHTRIKQVTTGTGAGTTYYLNDPISGAMEETFNTGSGITWRDYIMADGHMVALRSQPPSTVPPVWNTTSTPNWGSFTWTASSPPAPSVLYFTLDNLGSISVVADSSGTVVERDSYDAWGKRRNADGTAAACGTITSATTRGFTGQEMMDGLCTINFNARIYDPTLGRFFTPDPTTETVYDLQVLNRYSYVGNNPLSLTDPTGLCFLGCFWKSPIFDAIVAIAVAIFVPELIGGWSVFGAAAGGNLSAIATVALGGALSGAISAGLNGGDIFKGLLFGGLTAGLTAGLGGALSSSLDGVIGSFASKFVAYGLVGGLTSEMQGGKFASGFLAAGVGSLAGGLSGTQLDAGKLIASAVLGGVTSVIGGGKFENGAISGTFAYLTEGARDTADDNNSNSCAGPLAPGCSDSVLPAQARSGIESVTVTASRTYFAEVNFEATFLIGSSISFGIYYNRDFLQQGKSPIGLFTTSSQTFGLAVGASIQFGRASAPFGNFTSSNSSVNWGLGPASGSFSINQAGSINEGSFGPGTGLKFGFSGSAFSSTSTTPISVPDSLQNFSTRGMIPDL